MKYLVSNIDDPNYFLNLLPASWQMPNGISICWECRIVRYGTLPQSIDIRLLRENVTCDIGFTSPGAIGVVKADIARDLCEIDNRAIIGKCIDEHGNVIASHKTIYSVPRIVKRWRGRRSVPCVGCGRERYLDTTGTRYYEAREVGDMRWFTNDFGDVVVSQPIVSEVDSIATARVKWVPVNVE